VQLACDRLRVRGGPREAAARSDGSEGRGSQGNVGLTAECRIFEQRRIDAADLHTVILSMISHLHFIFRRSLVRIAK
jgi:hypothetical protein